MYLGDLPFTCSSTLGISPCTNTAMWQGGLCQPCTKATLSLCISKMRNLQSSPLSDSQASSSLRPQVPDASSSASFPAVSTALSPVLRENGVLRHAGASAQGGGHSGERPYACLTCQKRFADTSACRRHEHTHGEMPHGCNVCGKRFAQKGNLTTHLRTHTGEKPFACLTCSKGFAAKSGLTRHERFHSGERPYECQTCQKRFTQKGDLTTHLLFHRGEKPFVCQQCNKGFVQKKDVTRHLRTHSGERPYPCLTCQKRFADISACRRHERTHTGEKPYECLTCQKRFTQKGNLKQHMNTHTGEKPYACQVREQTFSDNSAYNKHQRKHVPNTPLMTLAVAANILQAPIANSAAVNMPQVPIANCEPLIKTEPEAEPTRVFDNTAQFLLQVRNNPPRFQTPSDSLWVPCKGVRDNLKVALSQWLRFSDVKQLFTFPIINDSYQQDVESMLKTQKILPTDPRVGLHGQSGVFAKKDIPAFTVLGIYVGKVYQSKDLLAREDYEPSQDYLFDLKGTSGNIPYDLIVDADGGGNWTALVNAYTTYHENGGIHRMQNCDFIKVHYRRIPFIVLAALASGIKAGEELLADYGKNYWDVQTENYKKRLSLGSEKRPIEIW